MGRPGRILPLATLAAFFHAHAWVCDYESHCAWTDLWSSDERVERDCCEMDKFDGSGARAELGGDAQCGDRLVGKVEGFNDVVRRRPLLARVASIPNGTKRTKNLRFSPMTVLCLYTVYSHSRS